MHGHAAAPPDAAAPRRRRPVQVASMQGCSSRLRRALPDTPAVLFADDIYMTRALVHSLESYLFSALQLAFLIALIVSIFVLDRRASICIVFFFQLIAIAHGRLASPFIRAGSMIG